jgi:LysR family hydrogen peroxide-inducible transcriptional activator
MAREQRDALSGELRLGIIPTLGPYLLPRFIQRMLDVHGDIRVTVREMLTADMIEALRRDMLDAGIAATPLAIPGINETPLFFEPFHGFVSAGHRLARKTHLSVGDFTADEMILLDSEHCMGNQVSRLCAEAPDFSDEGTARLRFVGGSLDGLVRIVESGHGLTLLPELAVMTLPAASRKLLRPLKSPIPTRQVGLVTHGDGVKRRLLDVLKKSILNSVPDAMKEKKGEWQIIDVKAT